MNEAKPAVRVGWVEITEPTGGLSYLPYATGLLQSYVMAHAKQASRYQFSLPEFIRSPIPEIVQRLALADIVGFSVYIWNINYSLAIAQALKKRSPQTLIIFGGPQVPDQPEAFLSHLPFIDLVCHGEGEASFLHLLETYPERDWRELAGISYLAPDKSLISQPRAERISKLDSIPSPYLSGVFEPLMIAHPEIAWAAIWETNRGCPFSCTFCDWGSNIASKVKRFGEPRLKAEMRWFAEAKITFLFCIDANYGIFPRDLEITQQLVEIHRSQGYPKRIITQMTKNQSERAFEAHKLLSDAGMLVAATLSLQSITPAVLTAIKRDNISLSVYQELLQRFVAAGIPAYTDILIGLPGETYHSFLDVMDTVMTQGQHHELRCWNVQLLPNSEMSAPAYRQQYGIQSAIVPCHSPGDPASGRLTGIQEENEIIIATQTLPHTDWIKTQALAWMVQLLYYSRLMQLPLLLVQALSPLRHRDLLTAFMDSPLPAESHFLRFIREFMLNTAKEVGQGSSEYCPVQDPLSGETKWVLPADYALAQLLLYQQLGSFFKECQQVIESLLAAHDCQLPPQLLTEALTVSQVMFEGQQNPGNLSLSYNLLECYHQIRQGQTLQLKFKGSLYPVETSTFQESSKRESNA